jgi:hypothetical protein
VIGKAARLTRRTVSRCLPMGQKGPGSGPFWRGCAAEGLRDSQWPGAEQGSNNVYDPRPTALVSW